MQNNLTHSAVNIPTKFFILVKLKFLFLMIRMILILCIYFTYDENVFSGLSVLGQRNDTFYMEARAVLISSISFFTIGITLEIFIMIIGFTFNFNKNNTLILAFDIFAIYLLTYFILDSWHYATLWYIFIVAQLPQGFIEFYGFIYSIMNDIAIYDKVKDNKLKKLKTH